MKSTQLLFYPTCIILMLGITVGYPDIIEHIRGNITTTSEQFRDFSNACIVILTIFVSVNLGD